MVNSNVKIMHVFSETTVPAKRADFVIIIQENYFNILYLTLCNGVKYKYKIKWSNLFQSFKEAAFIYMRAFKISSFHLKTTFLISFYSFFSHLLSFCFAINLIYIHILRMYFNKQVVFYYYIFFAARSLFFSRYFH